MNVAAPARILTVCSHNRTRSVMTAAMLQAMFDDRSGSGVVVVESAGFGPPGLPAIPDAVDAMAARGLDISGHRSRPVTPELVAGADLVLTAERDHVVRIATASPDAFPRTMTLPEFVARAHDTIGEASSLAGWVALLTEGRSAAGFLRDRVGEIDDPTGRPPREFAAAVESLHRRCVEVVALLADRITR